jgi:4,5-dihydroxyphthalate decarboxylase
MSTNIRLTFASAIYDRMQALYTGEVRAEGIDLTFVPIDEPRRIFDRMSGSYEFDVSEYSCSEFVQRFARGDCPFVAIPIFPSRAFRHGFIVIRKDCGIVHPSDLASRRIGVPLYTMTAAIFIRGLLKHEYNVDLSKVHWVQAAMNTPGAHGQPTILPLLRPAYIEQDETGSSLNELIERGVIDATIGSSLPISLQYNAGVDRLFPNFIEVEKEYYGRTGIFPIMHLIAIRKEVYERYPFIASSLYNAFCASKDLALKKMRDFRALRYMTPWLMRDTEELYEVFGNDPWPYGVERNRRTLEALIVYLIEQDLIANTVPVDDLFVSVYE